MNESTLNLRDIHLPDAISWWPPAPGWWMLLATVITIPLLMFLARRHYKSKQLKRDIHNELNHIINTFQETQNKSQLAKSLSILLRRASISYYPSSQKSSAGLTGKHWLDWLDNTTQNSQTAKKFNSDIGHVLINAPYLPDNKNIEFDAQALIDLSQFWLLAKHKRKQARAS